MVGLALRYQIAQKVHAASDPHHPPVFHNDRARDVIDLLLLRDLVRAGGTPSLAEIKAAVLDIFAARAREAISLGYSPRTWPARITAYPHWTASYQRAAASTGFPLNLAAAVELVNDWLGEVDAS